MKKINEKRQITVTSDILGGKMKHKILITILCIIILIQSIVIFINLKNRYDLNKDGDVNVADAVYLLNYIKNN